MTLIDKVIFLLIPACAEASAGRKAGKPELCRSIMHLCPDIRRRGGFFQRRAEEKEQVYGGQYLVLGALAMCLLESPLFIEAIKGTTLYLYILLGALVLRPTMYKGGFKPTSPLTCKLSNSIKISGLFINRIIHNQIIGSITVFTLK